MKNITITLDEAEDAFMPARHYIEKWNYTVDANETVRYTA